MNNEQKLKQALQELDALKSKIEGLMKPELEVGKWYKGTVDFESLIFITEIENVDSYNRIHGYGFISGEWNYLSHLFSNTEHEESLVEATPQEVEEALVKEAKRRGYKKGTTVSLFCSMNTNSILYRDNEFIFKPYLNEFGIKGADSYKSPGDCFAVIFKDGKWAEIIEQPVDKFAELKEAYSQGKKIQGRLKGLHNKKWFDYPNPNWHPYFEYRIKPEEKPKVGDVVKAWCRNEERYVVGNLTDIKKEYENKYGVHILGVSDIRNTIYYANARTLTKQEAIELLFGKENEWNQTDLQTMADDIDTLKNKYPQYRFTITVEDNV